MRPFALPRARRAVCSTLAASVLAWAIPAPAVDKVTCVDAAVAGQRLRKEGQLVAARDRLVVCASPECPEVVSQDCTGWLGEVQRSLSSVTVKARGSRGEPLTDVAVMMDGIELAERAPTAAIEVDPGDHVFRCERSGFTATEQRVHLGEGERGREVVCQLASPAPSPEATQSQGQTAKIFEVPPPPESRPMPWTVWPLGGLAIAGAAGFTVFGLMGNAQQDSVRATGCAPYCKSSQVDPIVQKFVVADISLAVGALALGAAALVVLLRPSVPASHATRASNPAR